MKNAIFRAVMYLKYKKIKSIILICLFTIMSTLLLFSATLNSTISKYYHSLDNKNGICVGANRVMKMSEGKKPSQNNQLSISQLKKIEELDYVSDIIQSSTIFVENSKVEKVTSEESKEETSETSDMPRGGEGKSNVNMQGLKLATSTNLELHDDFVNEKVALSLGTIPTKDDELVISEKLAELNNLKLNSSIKIDSSDASKTKTYKIIGIYEYSSDDEGMAAMMVPENTMYVTYSGASELNTSEFGNKESVQYYIKSTDKFEEFKKDYYSITDTSKDTIELSLNDEIYQSTIKPLTQLEGSVNGLAIAMLVITSIIVGIISFLMIKERNFEIGVLYSLSENKKNIVVQFIIENIILLTIAFIMALLINFAFSSILINSLMNMDLFSNVHQGAQMMGGRGPGGMSGGKSLDKVIIESSYSMLALFKSYLYVVLVVSTLTIVTILQTLLKRPKEIINS